MDNTNQTIDMPMSVYIQESKQKIINAINACGLHISLVEMIMKDLYNEIKQQADITREYELNEYQKALTEAISKED